MHDMCGRVIQASPPDQLGLKIIDALDPRDNRVPGDPFGNVPPRYNGAPSQQLWVIRQNPQTGERSLDLLQWGLIPYWCKDKPKPPPINAKAETVDRLPMFREAYRKRRCIVPIDGFFEWMAVKGAKGASSRRRRSGPAVGSTRCQVTWRSSSLCPKHRRSLGALQARFSTLSRPPVVRLSATSQLALLQHHRVR